MYVSKTTFYWLVILFLLYKHYQLKQEIKNTLNQIPKLPKEPDTIKIITIQYEDKNYYLFDVLKSVGIMYDDNQRKGIEDLLTKDKQKLGFKSRSYQEE